jgi:hypothetical protein
MFTVMRDKAIVLIKKFIVSDDFKITLNPITLYIFIVWSIAKLIQLAFSFEGTIWELIWKRLLEAIGKYYNTLCADLHT